VTGTGHQHRPVPPPDDEGLTDPGDYVRESVGGQGSDCAEHERRVHTDVPAPLDLPVDAPLRPEPGSRMTTTEPPATTAPAEANTLAGTIDRLRATCDEGRTRGHRWRHDQLKGLDALLREGEDDLVDALVADLRRSSFEAVMFDIAPTRSEVTHALGRLRRWMRPRKVRAPLQVRPGRTWYQYEPLGVSLVISPWNYPVHLALAPLVGAFAAGNCAVVKPSELTPACSAALADLLPRYLDPDAVAVVEGAAAETLALIDQRPDHVFFTGSPGVGSAVMSAAAPHLIPVTLELGGKSPAIVAASANLDVTARRIAFGKLVNSGQTCVAPDYVLVDRRVRDEFAERIVETVARFSEGRTAPIVNQRHAARLAELVATAGGEVLLGGEVDTAAAEAQPTVVLDPEPGSRLLTEEIFGPVLPVVTVDSLGEAIAHVRRGTRPLATYLFTEERTDTDRVLADITTGGTVVNHVMMHLSVADLPFGGVGTSGMGHYHGHWGFEEFSHPKAVVRTSTTLDPQFIYPPRSPWAEKLMRRML
jgi:aldehyde dehydrogenase (NAD+)